MAIKKSEMEEYRAVKLARKTATKRWGQHSFFSYVVAIAIIGAIYLLVYLVLEGTPKWLSALGVPPSGIFLVMGTVFCGLGVSGLRRWRELNGGWLILYILCTLQGVVALARALAF